MSVVKIENREPETAEEPSRLPLQVVDHSADASITPRQRRFRLPSKLFLLPLFLITLFSGGIIGLYFQPPGLKAFFEFVGLQPGAGSNSPIAVPAPVPDRSVAAPQIVAGLGRLLPKGDVITIALPFGAGDARISDVLVRNGQSVDKGETIAVLDSLGQLKASLETAQANVDVREANLNQTREAVRASIAEAEASLQRSQAAADAARQEFERTQSLFDRRVVAQAALDQVDVVVAARNLDAARAEFRRAGNDIAKAMVVAPISGTILKVHVRAGEKPGSDGVADIGDIENMTAEVDIFQNQIGLIRTGQSVEIVADALQQSLRGVVSEIGLEVGRQTVTADDPAANTDARVVKVTVLLDEASSALAARFTNLEVVARIAVGEAG